MRRLSSNTAVKPQATSDSSAPPLSATLPHRRDRAGATEYDAYEYAALPVNVPKPGILLCTNGFDADPALSRTGTTTIAVAIRYRRSSGDQRRRDQETSPGEWASI